MTVQATSYDARFFEPGMGVPLDGSVQRSNSGYLAPGQTAIKVNLDAIDMTVGKTVPLLIPPPGKTFTITDLYISHDGTVANRVALLAGTTAGNAVPIFSGPAKGDTAPVSQQGLETQLAVPSGCTLFVQFGSLGSKLYLNLAGVQQSLGTG